MQSLGPEFVEFFAIRGAALCKWMVCVELIAIRWKAAKLSVRAGGRMLVPNSRNLKVNPKGYLNEQ